MARPNWTVEQEDAIRARKGTLLVSAAAGSGKTAVLVQRVIERITVDGCDADRLLVVTFTKAAAAEMKQRIAERLTGLMEEQPENTTLYRQRLLLERAHISTVHSFCSEVIRENFHELNISPTFRIAAEDEMMVLQLASAQEILNEVYESDEGESEDFRQLAELFSNDRDDEGLIPVLQKLYEFVRSHAFPAQWMREQLQHYEQCESVSDSIWGKLLLQEAERMLEENLRQSAESLRAAEKIPEIFSVWGPILDDDRKHWEELCRLAQQRDWDELRGGMNALVLQRWKSKKGWSDHPTVLRAKQARESAKERVAKLQKIFDSSEASATEELQKQSGMVRTLFSLVQRFSERLDEKKNERSILDFGDLEHLMLRLLYREENGIMVRTETAEELSQQFEEVMVDEYQDTNGAQDQIFRAVSRNETNLFMVGDVKQSIYSFRQADPALFLARQMNQPVYDREREEYPATVFLRRNFRSRVGVTDGCNFVFRQLMTEETSGIGYAGREELIPGAEYPQGDGQDFTFCLLAKPEKKKIEAELQKEEPSTDCRSEAMWIAEKIREMVDSGMTVGIGDRVRPLEYRDCCILLRSAAGNAQTFVEVLEEAGVPAWANVRGGFFATREIAMTLAFLQVIDNPLQDIPLLTVLYSPIYGFTPDELTRIRLKSRSKLLYDALAACREERADAKIVRFWGDLEKYRRYAATMDTGRLLRRMIAELRLEAILLAMRGGEQRVANLRLLIRYAQQYEQAGYQGLSGFLRYIERLKRSREDLNPASAISEAANVVKVMSIHHSKGLEFPVVFLADTGRRFNISGRSGNLLLHPRYGVGFYAIGETGERYQTAAHQAIRLAIGRNEIAEELRVLYVALTRAREKCFVLCSVDDPAATVQKNWERIAGAGDTLDTLVGEASSCGEWLLMALLRHPAADWQTWCPDLTVDPLPAQERISVVCGETEEWGGETSETEEETIDTEALAKRLQVIGAYRYPKEALTVLPVKTAISALAEERERKKYYGLSRPDFLKEKGLSAAERGSAMHKMIQFADFARAQNDTAGEILRLKTEGFLSETEVGALRGAMARRFFTSPLAERIRKADRVWKEYRFMLEVPATVLDHTLHGECAGEKVVLQGVADCVLEEGGNLVLIDYKTDYVENVTVLEERYGQQLRLYAQALEQCFGKPVSEKIVFSLALCEAGNIE